MGVWVSVVLAVLGRGNGTVGADPDHSILMLFLYG
jgi:hypothetical protein